MRRQERSRFSLNTKRESLLDVACVREGPIGRQTTRLDVRCWALVSVPVGAKTHSRTFNGHVSLPRSRHPFISSERQILGSRPGLAVSYLAVDGINAVEPAAEAGTPPYGGENCFCFCDECPRRSAGSVSHGKIQHCCTLAHDFQWWV